MMILVKPDAGYLDVDRVVAAVTVLYLVSVVRAGGPGGVPTRYAVSPELPRY